MRQNDLAKQHKEQHANQLRDRFLPVCKEDLRRAGIDQLDFVYVTGDAYVDHPSFGTAIISRVLQAHGYTVGILSQPDWKVKESIQALGRPRLGFLVSAGNMDSMVNHYTVSKKRRKTDAYTPGGVMGKRPDYAVTVYGNLIRQSYKDVPIILGGIEASLRRLAHYDYWSNKLKRSVLLDSGADLISYGMGEKSIVAIADALNSGLDVKDITFIPGTVYKARTTEQVYDGIVLPEYERMQADKLLYAESFYTQYQNTDPFTAHPLIERYPHDVYVIQNPPSRPLTTQEMDDVYALPYTRMAHPSYEKMGGVPATKEIQFSITSNRGCFGACSFCALTFHQGRIIQTRSHASILQEAEAMTHDAAFKGYIHDVGGPTANFRHPACKKQMSKGVCQNRQCLWPSPCPNLDADHSDYVKLLQKLRALPGVKKVFIRSGIRFDYLLADGSDTFIKELCKYHVSGQLKVAPEHISDAVLEKMGKPKTAVYRQFVKKYQQINRQLGMDQYLVPYLMSSHPGSTLKEAVELAEYLRDLGYMPEQVQDFYPTPSTLSTCMYYTGVDPRTMQPVYVPVNPHEKAMQRALIQYRDPKNYELVKEALNKAGRRDLIGFDKNCLIPPRQLHKAEVNKKNRTPAVAAKYRKATASSENRKATVSAEKRRASAAAKNNKSSAVGKRKKPAKKQMQK